MKVCGQEVVELLEGYDCSSWTYGLANNDLDCLTKEQQLNDNDISYVCTSYYIVLQLISSYVQLPLQAQVEEVSTEINDFLSSSSNDMYMYHREVQQC